MVKVDCVREACEESYNRGFSEGFSEGFFEVLEDVARNMLAINFSDDEICELTGLPLERILKLKKTLNPDCL